MNRGSEGFKLLRPVDTTWGPHPQMPGIQVAYLLSHRQDKADLTCALVQLPTGSQPQRHRHEHSDDILYVIRGNARMWIDGLGDLPLTPGTFLRIPKGVWHQPRGIQEDLTIHDVWYPYLE